MAKDRRVRAHAKCAFHRGKVDERAVAADCGELEQVSKLTHVPRPRILVKTVECLACNLALADLRLHETNEVSDQGPDVVWARTERRNLDDQAMDSIVEVRTKATFANHGSEVPVRGAKQSDVDASRRFAAHPTHLPGFEDPEKAALKVRCELGDLV